MKTKVKLTGFSSLKKNLEKKTKTIDSAVKTVVTQTTADLKKEVDTNTLPGGKPKIEGIAKNRPGKIFTKGYSDANIHDSLMDAVKEVNGNWEGVVMSNQEHSATMEFGGRYIQPEPFMKPAFEKIEPKFQERLSKLVK